MDLKTSAISAPERDNFAGKSIGVVYTEWNSAIVGELLKGCLEVLREYHITNIPTIMVPGSFELSLGAQWLARQHHVDAVVALGCVIKGETPHFEYICEAVTHGINRVALDSNKPVIFGVLTTLTEEQAVDRIGGKHGHKGREAALTAIKMLSVQPG